MSYASDGPNKPLEFYMSCLRNSNQLDLRLGYFSSNAIRVLSVGFAQFIFNGGTVRIITNHYLSENDKKLLTNTIKEDSETYRYIDSVVNEDVQELEKVLSKGEQHFFNCLTYLLDNNRLVLLPVKIRPGKLSHYKEGIFYDRDNKVYFNGSCNFTYSGLVENGESLEVKRSWGSEAEKEKIQNETVRLNQIFSKTDEKHEYLGIQDVETVIRTKGLSKDLEELVKDEVEIIDSIKSIDSLFSDIFEKEVLGFKNWIREELKLPMFPHKKPFDYQVDAYNAWVDNNYSGIFAMATGTGKTITSLNCILEEYQKNPKKTYRAFILAPTITLVEQWEQEALKFNFRNIIKVSSKSNWRSLLATKLAMAKRIDSSFIIISTYATFSLEKFQKYVLDLPADTIFIADEAHNMGATSIIEKLPNITLSKRIALSATPKRIYDEEGTKAIESFFNDKEPYIVSYSMEKAIENDVLTKYDYYPHIVRLTSDELDEYGELSKKIARQYFIEPNISKNSNLERLLLQRKRIIHKATNKLSIATSILKERYLKEGNLKYTFVYVPEGLDPELAETLSESSDEARIINQYIKSFAEIDETILVNKIVGGMSNRKQILDQFSRGEIDVLTSMKCLDEGVDIPRAEHAIFCSSTGNPRQFIQRRGRVLRKHDHKTSATVHDLVVIPIIENTDKDTLETEKKLVTGELQRVMYFASLSKNPLHSFDVFQETCEFYNIDIYSIFNELKND
ncbi:MAG: DEAD/DEAH box helicase family protein [Balneolaceae bacterium]